MPVYNMSRGGAEPTRYLFIDGNYLRMSYEKLMEAFFDSRGELDLRTLKGGLRADKAFYYDAVDDTATGAVERQELLARIQRFDSFHVRAGTVSGGRRRRQKQVDVQLAVDMLGHAFRGNYTHGDLVAGDLDFRPLVEELVALGTHVRVIYERSSVAADLLDAADSTWEMTLPQIWQWSTPKFQRDNPLPEVSGNEPSPNTRIKRKGKWKGRIVELFESTSHGHHLWVHPTPDEYSLSVRFQDLAQLERYFNISFGEISWE